MLAARSLSPFGRQTVAKTSGKLDSICSEVVRNLTATRPGSPLPRLEPARERAALRCAGPAGAIRLAKTPLREWPLACGSRLGDTRVANDPMRPPAKQLGRWKTVAKLENGSLALQLRPAIAAPILRPSSSLGALGGPVRGTNGRRRAGQLCCQRVTPRHKSPFHFGCSHFSRSAAQLPSWPVAQSVARPALEGQRTLSCRQCPAAKTLRETRTSPFSCSCSRRTIQFRRTMESIFGAERTLLDARVSRPRRRSKIDRDCLLPAQRTTDQRTSADSGRVDWPSVKVTEAVRLCAAPCLHLCRRLRLGPRTSAY